MPNLRPSRRDVLLGAAAAAATAPSFFSRAAQAKPSSRLIDRHVVYALDVSLSVNGAEYLKMMEGLAHGIMKCENLMAGLTQGARYAFSIVFYDSYARHTVTRPINFPEDASLFVHEKIFNLDGLGAPAPENETVRQRFIRLEPFLAPRPNTSGRTNIVSAIEEINKLFEAEDSYDFLAISRVVLLIGDGENNGMTGSGKTPRDAIIELSQRHNATVIPIAIVDETAEQAMIAEPSLTRIFRETVQTPKGLHYIDPLLRRDPRMADLIAKGVYIGTPVRAGKTYTAFGFRDFENAVTEAMALTAY